MATSLEVNRSDQIDLVQLVGGTGLRAGVLLAGQQRGEANPWRRQTVAFENPFDGAGGRERLDAESLQFTEDGRGAGQAVASGRHGVRLGIRVFAALHAR